MTPEPPGIDLRPVERDHVRALIGLDVTDDQRNFVSSNAASLAQAAYETGTYPFGIWDGSILVGFCQLIDEREHLYRREGDDPDQIYLWRFMIDRSHQGKGYGRAALTAIIGWARARGAASLALSVVPENSRAVGLYESLGFTATGRIEEGEAEMLLKL